MSVPHPAAAFAGPLAEYFEAQLAGLPLAAYACDAQGRIVYYNERAARLWGRRPDPAADPGELFSGAAALRTADGVPLPHVQSHMARALADDAAYEDREIVIVQPDGDTRTVIEHVTPAHDAQGALVGAWALLVDITARARAARAIRSALAEAEANFSAFFDNKTTGMVLIGMDGKYLRVNDKYCEITGYSREELLQLGPLDIVHPDDLEQDLRLVIDALENPTRVYDADKRYVRKDGTVVWVHAASNLLRDETGRPLKSAAIIKDVTERKRTEQALHDADRAKDEFLATLAHELRNPLAPLGNAAELLREPSAEPGWCRDVITRQVTHLARLIDDLLDVSRIARDQLELRRERIRLGDALRGAIEASRPTVERFEQRLVVAATADEVEIDGDLVRLTQVFTNLLTNAAKFTEGAGTVRISAEREHAGVAVRVTDTGIGMAADELPRVFDKFYQIRRRGKHVRGGLGIGLSLVQRLVELHGGTVEASSPGPGRGSEFVVRLPVATRPAAPPQDSPLPAKGEKPRRKVLIVDDNVDGADSLCRLLELMGHEAVTEYDGQAALERAREFSPDLVLLDLGMPGLDGYEVCKRLRAKSGTHPPVIAAMTGWGRPEDRERTRLAGFDAHIVKPVDVDLLADLLARAARG